MNYNIQPIPNTQSIGDSLLTINNNCSALDAWASTIQLSAENYWIPLLNFFQSIRSQFEDSIVYGTTHKANWDSVTSTVGTNSAKWIEPLVLIYPEIITIDNLDANGDISSKFYGTVTDWLNSNYPCIDKNGNVIYIQNQKAYIYFIKQEIQPNQITVNRSYDQASCSTQDVTVCVQCTTHFTGYAACSNGGMVCDGQSSSCTECATEPCDYQQTGGHYYSPNAENFIKITWQDIRESTDISCLYYHIENCVWNFVSQI